MHRNELQADFHAIFKDIYLKVVAYKRHYRIVYAYKTLLNILFCNDTKIIYGHESVHIYTYTYPLYDLNVNWIVIIKCFRKRDKDAAQGYSNKSKE